MDGCSRSIGFRLVRGTRRLFIIFLYFPKRSKSRDNARRSIEGLPAGLVCGLRRLYLYYPSSRSLWSAIAYVLSQGVRVVTSLLLLFRNLSRFVMGFLQVTMGRTSPTSSFSLTWLFRRSVGEFLSVCIDSVCNYLLYSGSRLFCTFLYRLLYLYCRAFRQGTSRFATGFQSSAMNTIFVATFYCLRMSRVSTYYRGAFTGLFQGVVGVFGFLRVFSFRYFASYLGSISMKDYTGCYVCFQCFLGSLVLVALYRASYSGRSFATPNFLMFYRLGSDISTLFLYIVSGTTNIRRGNLYFDFVVCSLRPIAYGGSGRFFKVCGILIATW